MTLQAGRERGAGSCGDGRSDPERTIDLTVRRAGIHARAPGQRERARTREVELASDHGLRIGAGRYAADRVARHEDDEWMRSPRGPQPAEQVTRHCVALVAVN